MVRVLGSPAGESDALRHFCHWDDTPRGSRAWFRGIARAPSSMPSRCWEALVARTRTARPLGFRGGGMYVVIDTNTIFLLGSSHPRDEAVPPWIRAPVSIWMLSSPYEGRRGLHACFFASCS